MSGSNGGTRRPSIRPVSREAKKPPSNLQDCRCFEELDRRIRMGWTSIDLVKFIQEENNELTHLSSNYVKKMVDVYRRSIPPAEILLSSQSMTASTRNASAKFAAGINELEELNRLYDLQMQRISIDVENEKKINKLFQTTGREIFYAMKILKQSSELKMDLGIAKRQLGEVSLNGQAAVQIADRYSDGIGKVMTDPDSRRKVLGMVEALMSLGSKANLDAAEIVKSAVSYADGDVIDTDGVEIADEDSGESSDSSYESNDSDG